MRRPQDFERAVRRGVRCSRSSLVVYLSVDRDLTGADRAPSSVVGFVVSKAVGNAVARNRVKRRLRAVVSHRIDQLPQGGRLVVRALQRSSTVGSAELARDFDAAFDGARRRVDKRATEPDAGMTRR